MTEDEIFTCLAKAAIDKYPIIPSNNHCSKCPIRFVERNLYENEPEKYPVFSWVYEWL